MATEALEVLVVSQDRQTAGQLSRLLGEFGYNASASLDVAAALQVVEASPPDFLIVDEAAVKDDRLERLRERVECRHGRHVHTLLLAADHSLDVNAWVETGVDDLLQKPINSGEVLARLRAAARYVEFERRLSNRANFDLLTGLPNRNGLVQRSRRLTDDGATFACALVDLDLFARINFIHGLEQGNSFLRSFAETLRHAAGERAIVARIGCNRFAVLLPDRSADDAAAWAEEFRREIANAEHEGALGGLRLTASFGVYDSADVDTIEEVLGHTSGALTAAKQSGRDCVVAYRDVEAQQRSWTDLVKHGNLFEGCSAGDLMTPFTRWLRTGDTISDAVAAFRESGLEVLPVVDENEDLLGLVIEDDLAARPSSPHDSTRSVDEVMTVDFYRLTQADSFAVVMAHFANEDETLVAIVQGEMPRGIVTRNSFLDLIEPVTRQTFAPDDDDTGTAEYLLVPDLVPE